MNEFKDGAGGGHLEIAHSLDDPRIPALKGAIAFLDRSRKEPEGFTDGPWVGVYSSGSRYKQAVALEAIPLGIVPIISPVEPLKFFRFPEWDPLTGDLEPEDIAGADTLADFLGTTVAGLRSSAFKELPLSKQAEAQALFKALFDFNVYPDACPYVWATDIRAKTGDYPLQKEQDPRRQRATLLKIADEGIIDLAVGVAIGRIVHFEEDPLGLKPGVGLIRGVDAKNFVRASQELRLTVKMNKDQVEEYLARAKTEIPCSGLVLDVLGPTCQEMSLVTKIEIKRDGSFQEVPLETVKDIIAGYPKDLLLRMLREKYPGGNYKENKAELKKELFIARARLYDLYHRLTGEDYSP